MFWNFQLTKVTQCFGVRIISRRAVCGDFGSFSLDCIGCIVRSSKGATVVVSLR